MGPDRRAKGPRKPPPPLDQPALEAIALRYLERFQTSRARLLRLLNQKIRQLSDGFTDDEWISEVANPVLGELLQKLVWPSDLCTIDGDSMQDAGIFSGDLAVVDRAIEAAHGHVVVALLNNDPICKRLWLKGSTVMLVSDNPKYPNRYIMEGDELSIWGVITHTVRNHGH